MTESPQRTPFLRLGVPLFLVLPVVALTCVCAFLFGFLAAPSSGAPTQQPPTEAATLPAPPSTRTPAPSATSTPTHTRTPTATATTIPTETPHPGTLTAQALSSLQTAESAQKTATRQAIQASQTALARVATTTREFLNAQRTQSARSTATYQALLAQFERVNIQDIVSYPGSFAGQKIIVRAEVYEIGDSGREVTLWLYSWAGSGFTTAFMRVPLSPESGVLEGYTYNVYGIVADCPIFTFYDLDGYCINDAFIPTGD